MREGKSTTEDKIINDNVNNYVGTIRNTISIKPNIVLSSKITNTLLKHLHIPHHINNNTISIKKI